MLWFLNCCRCVAVAVINLILEQPAKPTTSPKPSIVEPTATLLSVDTRHSIKNLNRKLTLDRVCVDLLHSVLLLHWSGQYRKLQRDSPRVRSILETHCSFGRVFCDPRCCLRQTAKRHNTLRYSFKHTSCHLVFFFGPS